MLSYGIMKQVLSLLTAFVLFQTQSWALSGGPVFPTGAPNLAGIYSGVMVQREAKFGIEFSEPNSGVTGDNDNPAGNIGVFTVTVPETDLATGTLVLFVNGTVFTGTIDGFADPDAGTFVGVIQAEAQNIVQVVVGRGQMETKIKERPNTPYAGRTDLANGNAARMTGSAIMDASQVVNLDLTPRPNVQVKYSVSGYRQVTTPLQ